MKDREKIVEAVGRALCHLADYDAPDFVDDVVSEDATIMLAALEAELASRGLAILPVEATPEQITNGWVILQRNRKPFLLGPGAGLIEAYRAMTAAYLKKE